MGRHLFPRGEAWQSLERKLASQKPVSHRYPGCIHVQHHRPAQDWQRRQGRPGRDVHEGDGPLQRQGLPLGSFCCLHCSKEDPSERCRDQQRCPPPHRGCRRSPGFGTRISSNNNTSGLLDFLLVDGEMLEAERGGRTQQARNRHELRQAVRDLWPAGMLSPHAPQRRHRACKIGTHKMLICWSCL